MRQSHCQKHSTSLDSDGIRPNAVVGIGDRSTCRRLELPLVPGTHDDGDIVVSLEPAGHTTVAAHELWPEEPPTERPTLVRAPVVKSKKLVAVPSHDADLSALDRQDSDRALRKVVEVTNVDHPAPIVPHGTELLDTGQSRKGARYAAFVPLSGDQLEGLDGLLDESVLLAVELDLERLLLGLTFYVEMLPADGERDTEDLYLQLLLHRRRGCRVRLRPHARTAPRSFSHRAGGS